MKAYYDFTKSSSLGLRSLADFLENVGLQDIKNSDGDILVFAKNLEFYFGYKNDPIPKDFTYKDLQDAILDCFGKINDDYEKLIFQDIILRDDLTHCEDGLQKAIEKKLKSIDNWKAKINRIQYKREIIDNNIRRFAICKACCEQKNVGFKIWFYKTEVDSVEGYKVFLLPFFILDEELRPLYFKMYQYRSEKYSNEMFTFDMPNNAYFTKFIPFEKQ